MTDMYQCRAVVSVRADLRSPPVKIHDLAITKKALAVLATAGAFLAKRTETGLIHLFCKDPSEGNVVYDVAIRQIGQDAYTLRSAYLAGDGSMRKALCSVVGETIPLPSLTYMVDIQNDEGSLVG